MTTVLPNFTARLEAMGSSENFPSALQIYQSETPSAFA